MTSGREMFWRKYQQHPQTARFSRTHFDAATVALDDVARNRQPQSESAIVPGARIVGFEEGLEYLGAKGGRNSRPVVKNLDFDLVGGRSTESDGDIAAVLDGVFHDVGDSSR